MSDIPGSSGAPPPTASAKKRKRKAYHGYDVQYEKSIRGTKQRLHIRVSGEVLQRFEDIKRQMNLQTNEYVLSHLLDT